jgi:hypothetical protein
LAIASFSDLASTSTTRSEINRLEGSMRIVAEATSDCVTLVEKRSVFQAASWHRASVSVGRTKNLLKTLQFKRICPTYACTKPRIKIYARGIKRFQKNSSTVLARSSVYMHLPL